MTNREDNKAGIIGLTVTGLAWGAVLAEAGVSVLATDMDEEVLNGCLEEGEMPGVEPGLEALATAQLASGNLTLCPNTRRVIRECPVIFITAMVPPDEEDRPSLRFVEAAVRQVAGQAPEDRVIAVKAPVALGSTERLQQSVDAILSDREDGPERIVVTAVPELYDDGQMVRSMAADGPLIIGCDGEIPEALAAICAALDPQGRRTRRCSPREAELAVFAEAGRLAAELAWKNEMAALCGHLEVDGDAVAGLLKGQRRVRSRLVENRPLSLGYGGSRLPREVREWAALAGDAGLSDSLAEAFDAQNARHGEAAGRWLEAALAQSLAGVDDPVVAVVGASSSPGTDDLRETPAVEILKALAAPAAEKAEASGEGVDVKPFRLYVPWGMDQMKWRLFKEREVFTFCDTAVEATRDADALIVLGSWPGGSGILMPSLKKRMRGRLILDAAALFSREKAEKLGFEYRRLFQK